MFKSIKTCDISIHTLNDPVNDLDKHAIFLTTFWRWRNRNYQREPRRLFVSLPKHNSSTLILTRLLNSLIIVRNNYVETFWCLFCSFTKKCEKFYGPRKLTWSLYVNFIKLVVNWMDNFREHPPASSSRWCGRSRRHFNCNRCEGRWWKFPNYLTFITFKLHRRVGGWERSLMKSMI